MTPGNVVLSPLDWLMPRSYVSQILCFPADDSRIFEILKEGLSKTVEDVPYLLSGVVDQEYPKGSVRLTDPYQTVEDLIAWQDLSETLDYALLKAANFPPSALTIPSIKPRDTAPPLPTPEPVVRAKLSLIKGGILLCVSIHHSTTDITGFGALLKLWASHCRTESSADVGPKQSWYDRSLLIHSPEAYTGQDLATVPELVHIVDHSEQFKSVEPTPKAAVFETRVFRFPEQTLQDLKTSVNRCFSSTSNGIGWVSTGDIVAALLWSAIIWAEQDDIQGPGNTNKTCTAGIPVNFRSRFDPPLPKDYLGAAIGMTTARVTRSILLSLSTDPMTEDTQAHGDIILALAHIAGAVRESIGRIDGNKMRSLLDYTASRPDITSIKLGPRHDGISLVSWANEGVYELDWGKVLGRCESVRLPRMAGRRYPIVLPKLSSQNTGQAAGLEVIASFDEKTMERFCQSRLIRLFATTGG